MYFTLFMEGDLQIMVAIAISMVFRLQVNQPEDVMPFHKQILQIFPFHPVHRRSGHASSGQWND